MPGMEEGGALLDVLPFATYARYRCARVCVVTGEGHMKKSGTGGGDNPRSPTDVDRLVGENIRRLRIRRNLTLAQTAGELGISHQQLQKYETGANRLSAGTLYNAAAVLGVSIETLFVDEDTGPARPGGRKATAMDKLRSEGTYWLGRAGSEQKLRQMVQVLKALSSGN